MSDEILDNALNSKKRERVVAVRLTLKEDLILSDLALKVGMSKSTLTRWHILPLLSAEHGEVKKLLTDINIAEKQRSMHRVKFRIKKFWVDNAQFQVFHRLSTGSLDFECFMQEITLLEDWYEKLPYGHKKYVTKDLIGIQKFKNENNFKELYDKFETIKLLEKKRK